MTTTALVRPTHAPSGDPYRDHADGCSRARTLSFELRAKGNPWKGAGHATHCCECGAFLPCLDAIVIANPVPACPGCGGPRTWDIDMAAGDDAERFAWCEACRIATNESELP